MPNIDYYAYVDKAEETGNSIFLEFHCLPVAQTAGWLDLTLQAFRANLVKNEVPIITLDSDVDTLRRELGFVEDVDQVESGWYLLKTNKEQTGIRGNYFSGVQEDIAVFVSGLNQLDPQTITKLNAQTSIDDFEDASEKEIIAVLNGQLSSNAEYVAVYNVGQGNCNAICNDRGMPLLYFDLGGGCYANKHTYTSVLRFCFTESPAIVLSHWDTDHYESARRDIAYQAKTWIIPRQILGPAHNKFLLSLNSSGTILIWPSHLLICHFNFGIIIRCNHPAISKKNHTGLALMAQLSPASNTIRDVLLPADAAYAYIPGYSTTYCDGLVATHHGAEFDHLNLPVPTPTGKSAIAYSYGQLNSYSHPRLNAVAAHAHVNRSDTVGGHIALCDSASCLLGCRGTGCDLQIVQTY